MDPFALQDEARRRTGWLVALGIAAFAATVAAAAIVFAVCAWTACIVGVKGFSIGLSTFILRPDVLALSSLLSVLVVGVGFLVGSDSLSSGMALMKGIGASRVVQAKLADGPGGDLRRLMLFNVCEEMSIASGVDMPSVWVLDKELDVNAFVAGTSPDSAALCVTGGALRYLERDELQGVIAHEFSHILNGDMLLNFNMLRLVGGITTYRRIGKWMFSIFVPSDDDDGRGCVRLPRGKGGKGGIFVAVYILTAALLWLVGAVGVFFARLAQCAVSRQREYLADAAAVQFTRNPEGLANALRLTYLAESPLRCAAFGAWRDDVAHMLFAEGDRELFATHPPVRDRIARLSPGGVHAETRLKERIGRIRQERKERADATNRRFVEMATAGRVAAAAADVRLPPALNARIRTPQGAGAVLVQLLRGQTPEGLGAAPSRAQKRAIATRCTIAIRDSATPAVRIKWLETVTAIAQEDGEIDSFEFMLIAAARRHLRPPRTVRMASAPSLLGTVARVIATVASFGGDPAAGYAAAEPRLSLFRSPLPPMPPAYDDAMEFLGGLERLEALPPLAKRELLCAVEAAAMQDKVVTDEEADYLSAVADAIGACGWRRTGMS